MLECIVSEQNPDFCCIYGKHLCIRQILLFVNMLGHRYYKRINTRYTKSLSYAKYIVLIVLLSKTLQCVFDFISNSFDFSTFHGMLHYKTLRI